MIRPDLILLGYIPLTALLFMIMKPRRAVLAACVLGWLFLPHYTMYLDGHPVYGKGAAIGMVVLGCAAILDPQRVLTFRPRWYDLPMATWCIVPFISSITNDLGINDGILEAYHQVTRWGLPYLIGRIYFTSLEGLQELAIWIFIGGVIYIPLCLWEIRMSPRLHSIIYGFHQSPFHHHFRFGGYRPRVFLHSGLALGMWMTAATVIGVWMWSTGAVRRICNVPMSLLAPSLFITTIACKALGPILLLFMGLATLFATKQTRRAMFVVLLTASPMVYMSIRPPGLWSGEPAISIVDEFIDSERAASLRFRLENEDILAERAFERPIFGWGGWGRHRVTDERGRDISVTDGLWIITLGKNGIVGLAAFSATLLVPVALTIRRIPPRLWVHPGAAAPAVLAVVVVLFTIDCLLNAMLNPIFVVIAGGLCGLTLHPESDDPSPNRGAVQQPTTSGAIHHAYTTH